MKDKKGNLNLIMPAVLTLVLGAIILVFGLMMLDSLKTGTAGTRANSITAEVVTQAELKANTSVTTAGNCEFGSFGGVICTNASASGIVIHSANYSVGTNYITNRTSLFSDSSWYCNYTFYDGGEVCNYANTTIAGMGKFGDYFDLIVLAIVIAVIISLLLIVFSMRKTQ